MIKRQALVLLVCFAGQSAVTQAADLLEVYQDAVKQDPILQQAKSQNLSTKTALPLAVTSVMPQLQFNGSLTRERDLLGFNNPTASNLNPNRIQYNAYDYVLALNQPLFNIQAWLSISSAEETVKQAEATYNAAVQDLITRTAKAYFTILEAQDNLTFVHARNMANKRQLDEAKQRFKVGLEAITTVYDAQAAFDNSTADEIAANVALRNANQALLNLTNRTYPKIDGLAQTLPLIPPKPKNPEEWVKGALKNNYNLLAAHYGALSAKKNIVVQGTGNLPVISANLNYENRGNTSPAFNGGYIESNRASLTALFPIFDGGATQVKTSKAKYDYQTAQSYFDQTYRSTEVGTRQTYEIVLSGISKIKADRQAVKSAELALESTDAQYKAGTRTIVDVLLAQQNLFQAQSTLAADQYLYINSALQLKALAGTLSPDDLARVNDYLHPKMRQAKNEHSSNRVKS